jgi:hypothetical protein
MRFLPPILASLVLAVAALAWGSILRPLIPKSFSRLDRFVLILLGGLGILGTILFCVGQVWFSRSAIVVVLLVGVLLSLRPLAAAVPSYRQALKRAQIPFLPAGIVLLMLLVTAVGGLALPIGDTNDDAIAYHYLGPKVWLREGVIRAVPDEVLTYFPVVVETQYAALMSIGGRRAPEFFAVIGLGCLLLTTASLAIRMGLDPSGAWWAAALVAVMPAAYRGAYGGFLDALFASFVLIAARLAFDATEPRHFVLLGIMCGISAGTKYTGIVASGLLLASSFLVRVKADRRHNTFLLKWLGTSCAVAIAIASPFYLRNWILYGCPIYPPPPSLLRYFPAKNMLPAEMQEIVKNVRETGRGMGGRFTDFLLLPFRLTYYTANFRGGGGIGLAPLALAPFGVVARRRDPFAKGILFFASLQVIAWFLTAQVSRYLIDVYVIFAVLGVLGWRYAVDIAARNGRILSEAAIAISVLYGLWMILPARMGDLHAAVSSSYERMRRDKEMPEAASFDYINSEPSVRKVLILKPGVAAYFLDKPYVSPFGRWGEQTLGAANVQEVLAQLPRLHATHILDIVGEGNKFALPDHPFGLTLVFEHEGQRIYRIDDGEIGARSSP